MAVANDGFAGISSERTVSDAIVHSVPNTLSSAHHFVSIKLTSRNFLFLEGSTCAVFARPKSDGLR